MNSQAFAGVDQEEFVFCNDLRPEYSVPCQTVIKKMVPKQWNAEKGVARIDICREVAGHGVSFSTDIWTFPSERGYMVITMHFIDRSWEMRSVIIAFTLVMYLHIGKLLADQSSD